MLSNAELNRWCEGLQLNEAARREIQHIRTSQPSRRVGGGKKNVSGRYPSRQMGVIIQFESHKVELPFIYQLEHDEDVLEYYDQPPPFKINCQSASGRNIGFYYTPDFFVIRTESAGWVECKTEEQLQELARKNPNRYILGENNRWYSPPADDHAQPFGFFFRLWSSAEINWTLHRNLEFLEDYYKSDSTSVNPEPFNLVISMVSAQPGITLAELFHHAGGVSTDDIYHLIASEEIYVDLTMVPLVEAERCFVFRDSISAASYKAILHSQTTVNTITSPLVNLASGTPVSYDGKALTIALVGENEILLKTSTEEMVEFSLDTFENLLRQGKITNNREISQDSLSSEAMELFNQASLQDLEKANYRYHAIQPYLDGEPIRTNTPQERSLRNWLADYRKAQQVYGYGYLGLLSFEGVKGRRQRRLSPYILDKMEKFIENHYETKKQQRKQAVYDAFVHFCSSDGIPDSSIPSYKTFIKEINRRSGYEQTLKREGSRAAYPLEPFYWELQLTTPRHGDFPFHICHIDHTLSDIELRCSKTGKVLGRAWITLLIDAFSRRILSVYATYDPPSYRSCMMVLRICVKRYGRLPQVIVTDNGKEFHSTYFETLLALFDCTLKHRPAAKSRFSGVCERLFGTANTQFFYNLAGNTQITKNPAHDG